MKRFIIKLFASSYHYWVWKQKREDVYYKMSHLYKILIYKKRIIKRLSSHTIMKKTISCSEIIHIEP